MKEYSGVVVPILKYLNGLDGCKAINIQGNVFSERGTPDIIGCYRGKFFALEAKTKTGKIRPDQEFRLNQWKAAGALVAIVRSVQDVREMIEWIDMKTLR